MPDGICKELRIVHVVVGSGWYASDQRELFVGFLIVVAVIWRGGRLVRTGKAGGPVAVSTKVSRAPHTANTPTGTEIMAE